MSYDVVLSHEARDDLNEIYSWIQERSPDGAVRWYASFLSAIDRLKREPLRFATAPEAAEFSRTIRQVLFKTKHGRTYRILYAVTESRIDVLYVRGPGEPPVTP